MVSSIYADLAPAINHFSHGLLDTTVRSTVLLGLVCLAVLAMRRASAATRHWVWLVGFVGLLLLPALSAALPGWRVLPRLSPNTPPTVVTPVARVSEQPAKEMLPDAVLPPASAQNGLATTSQALDHLPVVAAPKSVPAIQTSTVDRQTAASTSARRAPLPWTFWLALAWLVGSAMVLAHLLLGYLSLWLLQSRCARIDDGEWHEQLNRLRQTLGVRRRVQLLAAPGRAMPMTWGVWRAKLLLPDEAANWTPEQRKDVLLHELGHVRRFDCATQLLVQIACALYWFNPLVWFAWNRVQVERERACDDIVLNTGTIASTYAQHLLQSATAMPALRFVMPALAMARPSTLESRLCTILDAKRNRRGLSGGTTWATLGLLLIALVPVAVLHAQENSGAATGAGGAASVTGASTAAGAAPTPGAVASPSAAPATRPSGSARTGGRGFGGGIAAQPPPQMGEGPTCAFSATIYDVRLPADKIGLIDRDVLNAAAATPAAFEKALAELGTARPLYHTDQTVRLASDTITIGTQTPIVTSSRMDNNGRALNSIQYQQTGANFTIAGRRDVDAADRIECDLQIQLSAVAASSEEIAPNVKASLFRTATMSHKGAVRAKEPFVVLSADAASADENGKAVVYIARITLGAPQ